MSRTNRLPENKVKVLGFVPEVKWLKIADIKRTPEYQRSLDVKKVDRRLKKGLDWGKVKSVSISSRPDGTMWCYDGQHTMALIERAGYDKVPCSIQPCETVSREAELFSEMNTDVVKVTPIEKHNACLLMDERTHSHDVEYALSMFDIKIGTMDVNTVNCLGTLRSIVERHGGVSGLIRTLEAITTAFPEDDRRFYSTIVFGTTGLISRLVADGHDYKEVMGAIAKSGVTCSEINKAATTMSSALMSSKKAPNNFIPQVMLDIYNSATRVPIALKIA